VKKILLLSLLIFTTAAQANLHLAPPDFGTQAGRAIFVDFKAAEYEITYDFEAERVSVNSKITFENKNTGTPLFDLVPHPTNLRLNGKKVGQKLISFPGQLSKFRQVQAEISPGVHVLEMENQIYTNVNFHKNTQRVSSAFWIRDLKDRMFLEQYVPSNFEYDQYKITMTVNFKGVRTAHQEFYANGTVTQLSPVSWKIEYPEWFTVSCPYYHLSPKGWLHRIDFTYRSINGKNIPITVYSPYKKRTRRFKDETIKVMKELEDDYGPWGHPSFIAYGTMVGTGGMEHAGATATSFGALDHEMLHSYFAKGVLPANGNSGWIDEAIASWRDRGYQRLPDPGFTGSNLGAHSPYKRNTDSRAYSLGAAFMAFLDWRLQDIGGLKAFLKGYFAAYKHTVITTEHFKNNLQFFSGLNFEAEFDTYILGPNESSKQSMEENPNHPHLTSEQLKAIL
jgi:hypothetical protein